MSVTTGARLRDAARTVREAGTDEHGHLHAVQYLADAMAYALREGWFRAAIRAEVHPALCSRLTR